MAVTPSGASPLWTSRKSRLCLWPERPEVIDELELTHDEAAGTVTGVARFTIETDAGPVQQTLTKTVPDTHPKLRWETSETPPRSFGGPRGREIAEAREKNHLKGALQ